MAGAGGCAKFVLDENNADCFCSAKCDNQQTNNVYHRWWLQKEQMLKNMLLNFIF
jgi:hypothetical protein